jgi:hypothetical protein
MTLRKTRTTTTLCDFLGRVACSCPLFGVLMPKGGEVVLVGLSAAGICIWFGSSSMCFYHFLRAFASVYFVCGTCVCLVLVELP